MSNTDIKGSKKALSTVGDRIHKKILRAQGEYQMESGARKTIPETLEMLADFKLNHQ